MLAVEYEADHSGSHSSGSNDEAVSASVASTTDYDDDVVPVEYS